MILYGNDGNSYQIEDKAFKTGGEATLHEINNHPEWVAKLYKPEKRNLNRRKKLHVMTKLNVSQYFRDSIILPLVVLYDDNKCKNNFIGYIMDRVQNITELQNIYYKNELSLFQKVTVAMNLCIMINLVHGADQVIGDLNPKNIAFDKQTGTGVLIDTDSFHITVKKSTDQKDKLTFPCTVGVEALIAPELKEKLKKQHADLESVQGGSFTRETDLYALGFHIFALLMGGTTPYRSCVNMAELGSSKNVSDVMIDQFEAAKKGDFLFAKHVIGKKIPEDVPDFDILSEELKKLFIRCFVDGAKKPECRPSAAEYYSSLSDYRAMLQKRTPCGHYLRKGYNKPCEWCRIQQIYDEE